MLTFAFGVALTLVWLTRALAVSGRHRLEMGVVSPHWVAAHNASQPTSNI